ncbi:hypothetical protein GCM10025331_82300 [Actinoplanes utahensis]|nr:hypothetical protein Aut01nite_83640 [Actinoplanes utahensis]
MSASPSPVRVIAMTAEHTEQVLAIYSAGIATGNATFETTAPTWDTFDAARLAEHRYVAVDADGTVTGWIACSASPPEPCTPASSNTPSTSIPTTAVRESAVPCCAR